MATQRIYGYADPWMIKAGETLSFMVSGEGLEAVDAQLVRLIHGDENPGGPGFIEQAHKPDEFVALDQIARCEAFLQRLIDRVSLS